MAATGARPVLAQSAPAADDGISEVLVTASRVQRSGFSAPTPTTIVGYEDVEKRGVSNLAQILNEVPAFKATTSPATNGVRSIFPGSYYADMRGLGASRTLVLVDGRRFVPQITTGLAGYQVDLNQVPTIMVERTEVVTGGASAQWGSDAVAGVVNIILKKDFTGLNADVGGGVSNVNDNREYRAAFLGGTALFDDRAHLVGAVDFVNNDGAEDAYSRNFFKSGWGITANPCPLAAAVSAACPTGGNGLAQQLILPDIRYSTATNGGLINNTTGPAAALRGIQFGPGGTPIPFTYGRYVGTQFMQGGGSNQGLNIYTQIPLAAAFRRMNSYGRVGFDLSERTRAFVEASYGASQGTSSSLPARNEQNTPIVIRADNPFIPASIRAAMGTTITSFNLGRNSVDIGNAESEVHHYTGRVTAGFEGGFGEGWKWDVAYIHGQNRYTQQVAHDRILANFNFAADVVLNAQGAAVCRATVAGASFNAAAAGCQPLNLFGAGSPSQSAINYVTGTLTSNTQYEQNAAAANISGEPFTSWAGPVSLAAGAEWRSEKQKTVVDPIAEVAGYESTNARSLAGSFNVKEAYLETVIPLAANLSFAKSLDLNGAVRKTNYSTSGNVTTWKFGATWTPIDGLLLRAARSNDIRAPNLFELYTLPVSTITNVAFATGYGGGAAGNVATQQLIGGNINLAPEVAKTTTYGFSYAPSFLEGLQLSVDYYDIKIGGAIANLTTANVANFCTQGTAEQKAYYCSFIRVNPVGSASVYTITTLFQNLNQIRRAGIDAELSYRLPLARLTSSVPGSVTFRFSANRVDKYGENANGAGYIERAGETVSSPHFVATSSLAYDYGPLSLTAQYRYIGAGKYNATFVEGVQINDNTVSSVGYVNTFGSYHFTDRFEVYGVVNNVLDRGPPIAPQNFGYPAINTWFDLIGRSYRLGARYKF